jgi:hypothetical protein
LFKNFSTEGHFPFLCLLKLARKVIQQYLAFGRGTNAREKSPHKTNKTAEQHKGNIYFFPILIKKSSLDEVLFSRIVHKKLQQQQQQQRVSERKRRRHWTTASPEH